MTTTAWILLVLFFLLLLLHPLWVVKPESKKTNQTVHTSLAYTNAIRKQEKPIFFLLVGWMKVIYVDAGWLVGLGAILLLQHRNKTISIHSTKKEESTENPSLEIVCRCQLQILKKQHDWKHQHHTPHYIDKTKKKRMSDTIIQCKTWILNGVECFAYLSFLYFVCLFLLFNASFIVHFVLSCLTSYLKLNLIIEYSTCRK